MDWAQILVIILSIFLAVFLLLGIILVYLLIRVTKQIKNVTESAQRTVHGFERMVDGVNKVASPALVGKILFEQINKFRERKEKK
jgi:uncharacterized protein YoxC